MIIKKNYFRNQNNIEINELNNDLIFQAVDWSEKDVLIEEEDDSDSDNDISFEDKDKQKKNRKKCYEIRCYGISDNNFTICINIKGFKPYFYIKIDDKWTKSHILKFTNELSKKISKNSQNSINSCKLVKRKDLYWFSDNKLFKFIEIVFNNKSGYNEVKSLLMGKELDFEKQKLLDKENKKLEKRYFKIDGVKYDFSESLYETNISPLLRFFHDANIQPCGWIKIPCKKYEILTEKNSRCQLEINCNWESIEHVDKTDIGPLLIASFDIECTSCDGTFPNPERPDDEIIQIGTTVHRYGEKYCCFKNILTLKKCETITEDNIEVKSFNTEKELIIAWSKLIERIDPDVITGYNIWGFDMTYMDSRMVNGCGGKYAPFNDQFYRIYSRNHKYPAIFKEQKLESSALGENFLSFFQSEGIIGIDMLKLCQKDFQLESYKLDFVSKNFIKGKVKGCRIIDDNNIIIQTDNTDGLNTDSYISLNIKLPLKILNKNYLKEKFHVTKIEKGLIYIDNINVKLFFRNEEEYESFKNNKLSIEWYQNKNDLSPNELFQRYSRGKPEDIKEIALYCVKDCELVNTLIMKLEVITNNVGMGNVCLVPLTYLFLRGQGVKIFSLVAKQCRDEKFLVKVLSPKDIDNSSYEGAIVFDPKPGIYFEPIPVLDYASLYPSSMIAENISHETLVLTKEYDLEGNLIKVNPPNNEKYLELTEEYNFNIIEYDTYKKVTEEDKKKINSKKSITNIKPKNNDDEENMNDEDENQEDHTDEYQPNFTFFNMNKSIKKKEYDMEEKGSLGIKTGKKVCYYAENKNGEKGLMPRILNRLLYARRSTRASAEYKDVELKDGSIIYGFVKKDENNRTVEVAKYKEKAIIVSLDEVLTIKDKFSDFQKKVLDGLQLAFKVVCNSLYGQVGASTSSICFKELAASTTATGRRMVTIARDLTLEYFPKSKLVYGDSVTGDTPVIIRRNYMIEIIKISDLEINDNNNNNNIKWLSYDNFKPNDQGRFNKEQMIPDHDKDRLEIWSSSGWTLINKIIRHKTMKKIYRVVTTTGIVDVTEDHSLLDSSMRIIKPNKCKLGEILLTGFPVKNENIIENTSNELMKGIIYSIKDSLEAQKLYYELVLKGNKLELMYDHTLKLFHIVNISDEMDDRIIGKVLSIHDMGYTGYEDYVYDLETKEGNFHAGIGNIIVKNTDSVFISFVDYIKEKYGEVSPEELLRLSIETGKEASKMVSLQLKKPQDLEYEKTFYPFAIFSKKRYFGNKYEFSHKEYKQTSMGIVLKRRDNAPIVKDIYGGIIDIILNKRNIDDAIIYYKNEIKKLLDGNVDIDNLIISKSIKSTESYSNPTLIAHKVLGDRIGDRDPGNKPQSNDRIPYCYIDIKNIKCVLCQGVICGDKCKCNKCMKIFCVKHLTQHTEICYPICRYYKTPLNKNIKNREGKYNINECPTCKGWYSDNAMIKHTQRKDKLGVIHYDKCKKPLTYKLLQGDIIEHPNYILENKLIIDYRYYFEHQIKKPVNQIFELVIDNPDSITNEIIIADNNKKNGNQNITNWFKVLK